MKKSFAQILNKNYLITNCDLLPVITTLDNPYIAKHSQKFSIEVIEFVKFINMPPPYLEQLTTITNIIYYFLTKRHIPNCKKSTQRENGNCLQLRIKYYIIL